MQTGGGRGDSQSIVNSDNRYQWLAVQGNERFFSQTVASSSLGRKKARRPPDLCAPPDRAHKRSIPYTRQRRGQSWAGL